MRKKTVHFLLLSAMIAAAVPVLSRDDYGVHAARSLLTTAEDSWLRSRTNTVVLGTDSRLIPVGFYERGSAQYRGIAADYLGLIGQRLGIRFVFRRYDRWHELKKAGEERLVDGFAAAQSTPERRRFMLFTGPFVSIPNVIIVAETNRSIRSLQDLKGRRTAVMQEYAIHEWLRLRYPAIRFVPVKDDVRGLQMTAFGQCDAMVINLATATRRISRGGIANLKVAADTGHNNDLCFGVRSDWPLLHAILQKGLSTVTRSEREAIFQRWVRIGGAESSKVLRLGVVLMALIGVLSVTIFLMVLWNRQLTARVTVRTEALRRQLERTRQLGEQNRFLAAIVNNAKDLCVVKDTRLRIIAANGAFAALTGRDDPALLNGLTDAEVFGVLPEAEPVRSYMEDEFFVQQQPAGFLLEREEPVITFAGERLLFYTRKFPVYDESGVLLGSANISQDITAKKRAEEALQHSEENLKATLLSIREGVVSTDREGAVVHINRTALSMTGWNAASAAGIPLEQLLPLYDENGNRWRFSNGSDPGGGGPDLRSQEFILKSDNYPPRTVLVSAAPIRDRQELRCGTVVVLTDVTAQRELEADLRQTRKMESIGRLAGGIAHDFNNLLTGIMGAAELAVMTVEENGDCSAYLADIRNEVAKAADLTGKLLSFSRKGASVKETLDLHEPLQAAAQLLERTVDPRIRLSVQGNPQPLYISGDANQLQHGILNLGLNARDAVNGQGRIHFSLRSVVLQLPLAGAVLQPPGSGAYAELSVEDSGVGIEPDMLSRIFEPFFTTKAAGKGTGLGLAAVYGAMQQHSGGISVVSRSGQGTCFRLYFPLVQQSGAERRSAGDDLLAEPLTFAGLHGLIVEDEELVRRNLELFLEKNGCSVHSAVNGSQGWGLFQQMQDRISFVITDMVMPGLTGLELVERIRQSGSGVPVLLVSGYTGQIVELPPGVLFLRKPYSAQELQQAMQEIGSLAVQRDSAP